MSGLTDLNNSEIADFLKGNPLWRLDGKALVREFVVSDFASAVDLFNQIAKIADNLDHHPDMLLYGWNKLRITITTHSRGGITNKDIEFANAIDNLDL